MELSARIKNWAQSAYFAAVLFLSSICGVLIVLGTTSPASLGATGMLFAFGLFYIFFFAIFLLFIHIIQILFIRRQLKINDDEFKTIRGQISLSRHYSIAATLAFAPVILMALRSIGQLDMMSTALVTAFEIVAIFYILKR